jgi:hypothetical protein
MARSYKIKKQEKKMTSPPKTPLTSRVMAEIIYKDEMTQEDIAEFLLEWRRDVESYWEYCHIGVAF